MWVCGCPKMILPVSVTIIDNQRFLCLPPYSKLNFPERVQLDKKNLLVCSLGKCEGFRDDLKYIINLVFLFDKNSIIPGNGRFKYPSQ